MGDESTADRIPVKADKGVVFDMPRGRQRPYSHQKRAHSFRRDIRKRNAMSHGFAERLQHLSVDSKSFPKRLAKRGIVLDDMLKGHSRPPKSKLATCRRRTRSTLA